MTDDILMCIRRELKQHIDPGMAASGERFFKEKVTFYGVKTAVVAKIAKNHFKTLKGRSRQDVFALCEALFQSDYNEEAWIACEWAHGLRRQYQPDDFQTFEGWMNSYINNWAKCDTLCNHAIGAFVDQYPQFIEKLKGWTKSKNRWMRRGAAVSLIVPARRGKFLPDIFEIADMLLKDEDDLVRKGYGWMLKAASQAHQKEVFDYVVKNKRQMPRTALRYAIEKMPQDLKKEAMK
ncbi:MAG: DNA alkylation repair protein [Desulfobacteraceae bacterium]|nr:MAG: DNA alkylation repair protein [Desulfobacteraceae bacterium]